LRWFTPEEATVAEALASIIVPSDDETPGLSDVDVLGPSAISALDRIVAGSKEKQVLYSRGLLSFDLWAIDQLGCKYADLSVIEQTKIFKAAEEDFEGQMTGHAMGKAWRRISGITQVANGKFFASQLYPEIRSDCFRVFYTSRVSWVWLEYDGPPMDQGYLRLDRHR
jgi:hypothetical protein